MIEKNSREILEISNQHSEARILKTIALEFISQHGISDSDLDGLDHDLMKELFHRRTLITPKKGDEEEETKKRKEEKEESPIPRQRKKKS